MAGLNSGALNRNGRPSSVDPRSLQKTIFPYEAFEFDNPHTNENPRLKMKAPWTLTSSGLEAYEDGVDEDNLQEGDRRLILEGEVIKLQNWDADANEWIASISLGGYDSEGAFIDFLRAKGLIHPETELNNFKGGFRIPPFLAYNDFRPFSQNYLFTNLNAKSLVLGETAIEDTIDSSYTWQENPLQISDGSADVEIELAPLVKNTITASLPFAGIDVTTYSNSRGVVNSFRFVLGDTSGTQLLASGTANHGYVDSTGSSSSITGAIQYSLYLRNTNIELDTRFILGGNDTTTTTILAYNVSAQELHTISFILNLEDRLSTVTTYIREIEKVSVIYFFDSDTRNSAVIYSPVNDIIGTPSTSTFNNSYNNVNDVKVILDASQNFAVTDVCLQSYVPVGLGYEPASNFNFTEMENLLGEWVVTDSYWAIFNDSRDTPIAPTENGATVIIGGLNYTADNSIILTGPTGPIGPTGAAGPQGPTGNYNLDGGSAGSVYLPLQNIDGGSASG